MNRKRPLGNSNRPLNLDFVRGHFPALAGDWIFFDNAGGSQVLESVVVNDKRRDLDAEWTGPGTPPLRDIPNMIRRELCGKNVEFSENCA
jgi:hypothetical protein